MWEITDSKENAIEGVAGKRIMPSFAVPLIVSLMVLVSVMFFGSATGWVMGGAFIATGLVILSQRGDAQ